MSIKRPGRQDMTDIAEYHGMSISDAEMAEYQQLLTDMLASFDRIDELEAPVLVSDYKRDKGSAADPEDNPHNAWYWKTTIEGSAEGPLKGKSIAIKDNVCIAGVPMMNGSRAVEGYIPDNDATVVTRILDAGGTILGKATCEDLCLSGSSFTSMPHPVTNPHDPARAAGGSSSGSAVPGIHRCGGHGAWRRPGGFHTYAGILDRCLRSQTYPWSGPLHRRIPD